MIDLELMKNLSLKEKEQFVRKQGFRGVRSSYAVVWEDPHDIDRGVFITEPTPVWVGMATHGGFLPHIDFFLRMNEAESESDIRKIRGDMDRSEPLGPMSQEEFIEYTVMKDVPPRVWRDYRGNRSAFRIVNSSAIPKNRIFRDAWRLA